MSRRNSLVESLAISDTEGGDLGPGFGRKPGGIVISDEERDSSADEEEEDDLFEDLFAFSSADGIKYDVAERYERDEDFFVFGQWPQ